MLARLSMKYKEVKFVFQINLELLTYKPYPIDVLLII